MSEKTPIKQKTTEKGEFSPVIIQKSPAAVTPQRNLTGLPRVVRDIVADVYNNIQKWNDYHIKGANILKELGTVLSETSNNLTPTVESFTDELSNIVENLRIYCNALEFLASQIFAVVKLHNSSQPLFMSLTTPMIADIILEVSHVYKVELKSKQYVLENIVFSRDKNEVMFHVSCWTYQQNILKSKVNLKLETLLVETGHRKFI